MQRFQSAMASQSSVYLRPVEAIANWGRANPFVFQLLLAIGKTTLADILVQKSMEGRESVDWRRAAVFAAFGGLYSGGFQYGLFVTLFARWYPSTAAFTQQPLRQKLANRVGLSEAAKQIAIRNFVAVPFVYWPAGRGGVLGCHLIGWPRSASLPDVATRA